MRPVAFVLVGAIIGLFGMVASLYLVGVLVESLGLIMYRSEADQQRNFNIAMIAVMSAACVGGWLGYRLAKRRAGG